MLHLDSSGLTLEETVDTVLRVVAEQAGLDWAVLVEKTCWSSSTMNRWAPGEEPDAGPRSRNRLPFRRRSGRL